VIAYRLLTQSEAAGDLRVGLIVGYQLKYLALSIREFR
jgi:hypothetical protein